MNENMSEKRTDGITERLVAQADKELGNEIDVAMRPLRQLLDRCYPNSIEFNYDGATMKPHPTYVLQKIKDMIFNNQREKYQTAKIAAFLKRVDDLADEVDEIRAATEPR